jgi:hypothetical protein
MVESMLALSLLRRSIPRFKMPDTATNMRKEEEEQSVLTMFWRSLRRHSNSAIMAVSISRVGDDRQTEEKGRPRKTMMTKIKARPCAFNAPNTMHSFLQVVIISLLLLGVHATSSMLHHEIYSERRLRSKGRRPNI